MRIRDELFGKEVLIHMKSLIWYLKKPDFLNKSKLVKI